MEEQNKNTQYLTIDLLDEGNGSKAKVKLEEVETGVQFTVDQIEPIGDIRGVFFNVEKDDILTGLTVTGENVTSSSFSAGSVNDLGEGANVNPDVFDGGVEIGTSGIGTDDLQSTSFILSNPTADVTLSSFLNQQFGLRLTSVGENRQDSSKLSGTAPEMAETMTAATTEETTEETTDMTSEMMDESTMSTTNVSEETTVTTTAESQMSETEMMEAEMEAVEESGIFEEEVYLAENADVAEAVANGETTALEHFVKHGKKESFRKFSRVFSVEAYLEANQDVAEVVEAGVTTAIDHYLYNGQFEKRECSYLFKTSYYLEQNTDVLAVVEAGVISPLKHFKKHGMKEGRKFNPLINVEEYLSFNADVKAAVDAGETTAIEHFFKHGLKEKRKCSKSLDVEEYLKLNPDVEAAVEAGVTTAIEHMFKHGFKELRKISKYLDLGFFAQVNASLLQSVFNVSEVSEIQGFDLVSYALNQSVAQGLQTSEFFKTSSIISTLSSQEISSFFGVASASEISFNSLVEFVSSLFTSIETSFTSQQISSFFKVASLEEVSLESLLKFVSTGFDVLSSSSSSTSISFESLLNFISSSQGQSEIGAEMDDDLNGENTTTSPNNTTSSGNTNLNPGIQVAPDNALINQPPGEGAPAPAPEAPVNAIPAPTSLLDVPYIIKNNLEALQAQFPSFDFASLTQEQVQQIVTFAEQQQLNTSAFVNISYFNTTVKTQVVETLISQGMTQAQIDAMSQEELIKKGIEIGLSPNPLIKLGWLKSVNGKKLAELGINLESNIEVFEFVTSKKGFALGLNLSPFFNPGFAKKLHKDKIREKFDVVKDVAGIANLEDGEVLDNVFSDGGIVIDFQYYREVNVQALTEYATKLGIALEELTDEQIADFALNEGADAGLALSPFKFELLTQTYSAELKQFFGVEDLETISEDELKQFMFGPALELGLDISTMVDVQFYKTKFSAALTQYVGAAFTDQDVIKFVFGDGAPLVDEDYFKSLYGETVTADGVMVKDLEGEELKAYIFTEGLAAGFSKLAPFDIAKYTTDNADKLLTFFGVDDVTKISKGQIREFMVKDGWKFGINLSDCVAAEDIEIYRKENEAVLKELYGVEDVSTLSAEVVLDAEFGGLTDVLDVDFFLTNFVATGGDVATAFSGKSIEQVTKLDIVEYLYQQPTLEAVELSPFKLSSYVGANKDQIAQALGIDVKEVAKLKPDEIMEFMLGEGVKLGISLDGFVADGYLQKTYAAAIASSLGITVEAVASLTKDDVFKWLATDYQSIDAEFISYQFEQLTATQQTDILTGLGLNLTADSSLSIEQLVKIAYSEQFKAVLQVEEVKLSAIDIDGYALKYQQELKDYFVTPGIKIKSGSKKLKSGSLKFGKSGKIKQKSGSLKFGSGSLKLKGNSSIKLKSKSLKVKSGNLKTGQLTSVDTFDVTTLTDKQIIEFMFDKGVELGLNPLEFVNANYLKSEFKVKIAEHYGIDVAAVATLSDALVVDAMYGGLSNDIDYKFVRTQYKDQLASKFGVAIEEVTDMQVLQYVYETGPANIDITPVDVKGFVKENGQAIAQQLGVKLEDLPTFSEDDVFAFIFKQGAELNLKLDGFVNFSYFENTLTENIVFNYREKNVFNFGADKVYDFISTDGQGLSASPIYDPEWYRQTYLINLNVDINGDGAIDDTEAQKVIDTNGDGAIDDAELEAFATGEGLDLGLETSDDFDFDADFADAGVVDGLLKYSGVTSLDQVTFTQKVEYITGQGLIDGYVFSGLQAVKDDATKQDLLLKQTGATSIDQITAVDLYKVASELALF